MIITNCPQTSNQFESIWHFNISRIITFSYCLWSSQDKNTEVVCHSLLQWATFCLLLVALHGMAHSFIELDKAMVHVISLISFL